MKLFTLLSFAVLHAAVAFAQSDCSNPLSLTICPDIYLTAQSNAGMGDDGPSGCNIAGEDVVYKISITSAAAKLFVSVVNASASMQLSLQSGTCGTGSCSSVTVPAGSTNTSFTLNSSTVYYLWVD